VERYWREQNDNLFVNKLKLSIKKDNKIRFWKDILLFTRLK